MALDLGKFSAELRTLAASGSGELAKIAPRLALMVDQIQDGVNQIGTSTGVEVAGHTTQPSQPSAINVKAANGVAHVTIQDTSTRSRALHYFVEADTDPSFSNPHVEHLGASRGKFFSLPGMNDDGDTQPWHFRAYSMNLGSAQTSNHIYFGGQAAPTPVDVGGSTELTPLASTGAGTASTTGQKGGQGFGTAQTTSGGTGPG